MKIKKKCTGKCGLEKTLDCFDHRKDSGKPRGQCKICMAKCRKAYQQKNKEKLSKNKQGYYQENKKELIEYQKEYKQKNKEKIIEYKKKYSKENKEEIAKYQKEYGKKNKKELAEYKKDYQENNKEEKNKYEKEKRNTNPIYKLMGNFRNGFKRWVKSNGIAKKGKSTFKYLLYSFEDYANHIKSQFEWWMTFKNQGVYDPKTWNDADPKTWKWQLDHIKPVSTFILKSIDDTETIQECWALSNLRPLSAKQNQMDGATRIRHKKVG